MRIFMDHINKSLGHLPYWLPAFVGRVAVGLVFWNSGQTKAEGWNPFALTDNAIALFADEYSLPLLSPELAATLASLGEHLLPVLLILGLATRFAALGLLGMTLIIEIFVYPDAYVVHGTWAAILLMLIRGGGGKASFDYLLTIIKTKRTESV